MTVSPHTGRRVDDSTLEARLPSDQANARVGARPVARDWSGAR